jgi:hypothetical protein
MAHIASPHVTSEGRPILIDTSQLRRRPHVICSYRVQKHFRGEKRDHLPALLEVLIGRLARPPPPVPVSSETPALGN